MDGDVVVQGMMIIIILIVWSQHDYHCVDTRE